MNAANHTSSLALSLLRHSSLPSESFVLSPFSFSTALSMVHDGASGDTQKELTNLFLKGGTPSEVTALYSSLALSLPSSYEHGVAFKSANRFYVDDSILLKADYQKEMEDKYHVKVVTIKMSRNIEAAKEMNAFVEKATEGKIKDITKAHIINAIYMLGKWNIPFQLKKTHQRVFEGHNGKREIDFMEHTSHFCVNKKKNFGTALIMDYDITVPKFKIESKLAGVDVLSKIGIKKIFNSESDLSKISDCPLFVTSIQHSAAIETDELGTEAASATDFECSLTGGMADKTIVIDRPFLFGIRAQEHIIFIGQFT